MAYFKVPFRMGGNWMLIYMKAKNLGEVRNLYRKITGEGVKIKKGSEIYTTEVSKEEAEKYDLENMLANDFYWIVKMGF